MQTHTIQELDELLEYCIINQQEYNRLIKEQNPLNESYIEPNLQNDDHINHHNDLPQNTEIKNNDGTITTITYSHNPKGQIVKTTRKIKKILIQKKIRKSVLARRNLKKFGTCTENPPGPEHGITHIGDIVHIEHPTHSEKDKHTKENQEPKCMISCRKCGHSGHWTRECPFDDEMLQTQSQNLNPHTVNTESNKYVPPSHRNDNPTIPNASKTNIRISNLVEDADEQDLKTLFQHFGHLKRVTVVKDRKTGESRGFAYVDYYEEADALKAMKRLHRYAYGSQILSLEWARPRRKINQ